MTHPPCSRSRRAGRCAARSPGGHTKNLFLRDKKGVPFLVVAGEDTPIELRALHRLLGATGRFSFGSAELMRELLGVEPGSVTPFAVINDTGCRVTVVLDAAMMAHEVLNFHPLVNTGTTAISRDGPVEIPRSHRAPAADRGAVGRAGRRPPQNRRLHSRRFSSHLIGRNRAYSGPLRRRYGIGWAKLGRHFGMGKETMLQKLEP